MLEDYENDCNLTVRMNKEIKRRFILVAKRKHRKVSELIREFAEDYIKENMKSGDLLK